MFESNIDISPFDQFCTFTSKARKHQTKKIQK
jgi:hypothetical protein